MSELRALIRACKAEPDDDAPRLILADWLEEHGEGERAAFIRAQIARPDDASIQPNLDWAGEWKRWAESGKSGAARGPTSMPFGADLSPAGLAASGVRSDPKRGEL